MRWFYSISCGAYSALVEKNLDYGFLNYLNIPLFGPEIEVPVDITIRTFSPGLNQTRGCGLKVWK